MTDPSLIDRRCQGMRGSALEIAAELREPQVILDSGDAMYLMFGGPSTMITQVENRS